MRVTKEMLSVDEFARKANITVTYARQLLREGKVRGVKIGKEWRISREEVDVYLGITTDIKSVEQELYIRELENKDYKALEKGLSTTWNEYASSGQQPCAPEDYIEIREK